MKKIIFFLCLLPGLDVLAQIPANDPTWTLKKQDDFNSFDASYWKKGYPWDSLWSHYDAVYNAPANIIYSGGWLKLKADSLISPISYWGRSFKYTGATLWSDSAYKFGYFEIEAKLPKGYGYWPAFWLWGGHKDTAHCHNGWGEEIDILEVMGNESVSGHLINNHYHAYDTSYCYALQDLSNFSINIGPDIDTTAHKYAVWWSPKMYQYYYDDKLIRTTDVSWIAGLGKHPINVVLDLSIDTLLNHKPGTSGNTVFPGYFQINYMKIWQQKTSCSTAEVFCASAFNKNTYNYAVKKSISLGGNGCTASAINTSDNVSFWATDYVTIDEGVTVTPNGSGTFSADITLCPN